MSKTSSFFFLGCVCVALSTHTVPALSHHCVFCSQRSLSTDRTQNGFHQIPFPLCNYNKPPITIGAGRTCALRQGKKNSALAHSPFLYNNTTAACSPITETNYSPVLSSATSHLAAAPPPLSSHPVPSLPLSHCRTTGSWTTPTAEGASSGFYLPRPLCPEQKTPAKNRTVPPLVQQRPGRSEGSHSVVCAAPTWHAAEHGLLQR